MDIDRYYNLLSDNRMNWNKHKET